MFLKINCERKHGNKNKGNPVLKSVKGVVFAHWKKCVFHKNCEVQKKLSHAWKGNQSDFHYFKGFVDCYY